MRRPIKHYNDFSISTEKIEQYRAMPMKKRLEWLYLGNVLRKAFSEIMGKREAGEQGEGKA